MGLVLAATMGCTEELGPCDQSEAVSVAFAQSGPFAGRPVFAGQALIMQSCGNVLFCHAPDADTAFRFGVPAGLAFDVTPAGDVDDVEENAIERLRLGQLRVFELRREIAHQVREGSMPPGEVGVHTQDLTGYRLGVGPSARTLASLKEPEGIAILTNWLACGSPVIEATTTPTVVEPPGSSCGRGPGDVGECVVASDQALPEPTWSSIFQHLILPACGRSCHGPDGVDQRQESALDLSDIDGAYASLVGVPAGGDLCGGTASRVRVVPGDPDQSLLLQKLEEAPPCGDPMPSRNNLLPDEISSVVRTWIAAGAPR